MPLRKIKVTLYIRHHKTQKYEKAENILLPARHHFCVALRGQMGDAEKLHQLSRRFRGCDAEGN
jgi:hypothetical protein